MTIYLFQSLFIVIPTQSGSHGDPETILIFIRTRFRMTAILFCLLFVIPNLFRNPITLRFGGFANISLIGRSDKSYKLEKSEKFNFCQKNLTIVICI